MEKTLYFCDFCETIRPHMSANSTIKKYRASSLDFVEDGADIGVKANNIRIFYPLVLSARTYANDWGQWPTITQSMASKLKTGETCVPVDYIPHTHDFKKAVRFAADFFEANIIPNLNGGMCTVVDDTLMELIANNCTKSKVKELKNYHKIHDVSEFFAAVFVTSLANNHKAHHHPRHRVEVADPNCKSRATKCVHVALMSEANHMCMGGCGTQLISPPCNENASNSEVVFVSSESIVNGYNNAVVLCTHCVLKFQIWTDDERRTLLERKNAMLPDSQADTSK